MSLPELLIAAAISTSVMGVVFTTIPPLQDTFATAQEAADVQQRLRVAVDALMRDLRAAHGVRPYRIGRTGNDTAAGVYFRPDTVSIVLPPTADDAGASATRTYYVAATDGVSQLMQYNGEEGDFPLVDDVVSLGFDYIGGAAPLDPSSMIDGPWRTDDIVNDRFDADLLMVRRVRVRLRVQARQPFRGRSGMLFMNPGSAIAASRFVPDQEIRFDVALRNWNAGS
jgi:hypothetical protein